jgi:hypothetical protein
MNPYTFSPRLVTSVDQARSILKYFDRDVATSIANAIQAEESLNATLDVLIKTNPDLAGSLNSLSDSARLLGNVEGTRVSLDITRSQFISALPYAIRLQLQS